MTGEIRTNLVQIKGVREGLLATLGEGSWADLNEALLQQVSDRSSFLKAPAWRWMSGTFPCTPSSWDRCAMPSPSGGSRFGP